MWITNSSSQWQIHASDLVWILNLFLAKAAILQTSSNVVECSECKARSTDFLFKLTIPHILCCLCPVALVDISQRVSYHRAGKYIIIGMTRFLIFPIISQSERRHTFHRCLISDEKFLFFIDLWLKCDILVNKWEILPT